ncbi:Stc1 domain-containing protein [Boeremia exigua]|uniref:Stc1 domain-containing protein n=1 Tax=Boeremia exigua TaxID=749465 RepID=UPI001E8E274C|nr:Stc1 domain-containing protein [Boeremia exigua]KAH6618575.1 Stc1 domain-containing protein [Boeremia exigua]
MCLRNYNQANFSQKQLTDVRYQVSKAGRINTNPKCFKCTGGQLVELDCVMCHKTKGLEEFAKTQRKNTDSARCYDCTSIQLEREPVEEQTYDDPRKAFTRQESSSGNYPDYFNSSASSRDTDSNAGEWQDLASTDGSRHRHEGGGINLSEQFQRSMSFSGQVTDTLIDSEFSLGPAETATWSDVARTQSWHTDTARSSSARTGFDPNRYGRPGTQSGSGSMHSFDSSIAERSQSCSDRVEMRNGFAKIKAYVSAPCHQCIRCRSRIELTLNRNLLQKRRIIPGARTRRRR